MEGYPGNAKALKALGADKPCPRCGHEDFVVLRDIYLTPGGVVRDVETRMSRALRTVPVMCSFCGYLMLHVHRQLITTYYDEQKKHGQDPSDK